MLIIYANPFCLCFSFSGLFALFDGAMQRLGEEHRQAVYLQVLPYCCFLVVPALFIFDILNSDSWYWSIDCLELLVVFHFLQCYNMRTNLQIYLFLDQELLSGAAEEASHRPSLR